MIIDISSSTRSTGLKKYLFKGTDGNRDIEKVIHVEGDFDLAETMKKNMTRKKKSMNFVISLSQDDDISDEKFIEICNDVIDNILHGMNREDVMVSSVIHNDTDHKHIHVEIIDSHLITGKPLELYMNNKKVDRERYFAIRDYIEAKYKLKPALNKNSNKPKRDIKESHFAKWLEKEEFEKFDIQNISVLTNTKKSRNQFQEDTLKYLVKELLETTPDGEFKIKSLDDLENLINNKYVLIGKDGANVNVKVVKKGYNKLTNYDFFTLDVEGSKKPIKIEADIFGKEFFELDRDNRLKILQDNLRPQPKEIKSLELLKQELKDLNYLRREFIFKKIGIHSDPKAIYPSRDDEFLEQHKYKDDSNSIEFDGIEEVYNDIIESKKLVLEKYNLQTKDLLEPELVETKSDGKVKFEYKDENKSIEKGLYIVNSNESLKESGILNKIKERLINVRKVDEIIRNGAEIKRRIDGAIRGIKEQISRIGTGIGEIKERVSKKIDASKYVQEAFGSVEPPIKVLNDEQLKNDFNRLLNSKKIQEYIEADNKNVISVDLKLIKKELKNIIYIDENVSKEILNIKVSEFINEFDGEKYKISAKDGQYYFQDKYNNGWYIMNKDDKNQYLFNEKTKEINTLFDFLKTEQHLSFLKTYSLIEEKANLNQIININFKGVLELVESNKDIKSYEDLNKHLGNKFDTYVKIRFDLEDEFDVPQYVYINDIKYEITEETDGFKYLSDISLSIATNNLPENMESLDDLLDKDTYLNPIKIENINKSIKHKDKK